MSRSACGSRPEATDLVMRRLDESAHWLVAVKSLERAGFAR
jgi:hypothetical protein